MTDEEFNSAVKNLLKKGLVKEEMIDGVMHYHITKLGKIYFKHTYSEPSERN